MVEKPPVSLSDRLESLFGAHAASPDRALKNFRYVVAEVNGEALKLWEDLWRQLDPEMSEIPVLPEARAGYTPPCGWPEFLEKFCLLKHYLDYVQRFSQQT